MIIPTPQYCYTSTHNLCFEQKYEKKKKEFLSENFQFLVVKFSVYFIPTPQYCYASRKHACIILTPLNPTFI